MGKGPDLLSKDYNSEKKFTLTTYSPNGVVITSLHKDIEEEFESIFLEAQAGIVPDHVEELVKEHNLDPLLSQKSNVGETAQNLSEAKNKLKYLIELFEKVIEVALPLMIKEIAFGLCSRWTLLVKFENFESFDVSSFVLSTLFCVAWPIEKALN
ncbi:UNVERIFIED_CONTAM: hypothetical protein Sradi_0199300 [Sesamum radiatum]|uniref:Uncharacterized protein n=1 Tax=Sesamum radiatum TaxID=300843 RepID=A0AAW2VZ13_SESRA